MCASSVISDYYQNTYPQRFPNNPNPFQNLQGFNNQPVDPKLHADMAKVLALLESIDKRLGDVECMDEAKAAFLAQFNSKKRKRAKTKA